MNKYELQTLRNQMVELEAWSARATGLQLASQQVVAAGEAAADDLRRRVVPVDLRDERICSVLALDPRVMHDLQSLRQHKALAVLSDAESSGVAALAEAVPGYLRSARALYGLRRAFSGKDARQLAEHAGMYLQDLHSRCRTIEISGVFDRMRAGLEAHPALDPSEALDEGVGLAEVIGRPRHCSILPSTAAADLPWAVAEINGAIALEDRHRQGALDAGTALRRAETDVVISDMPIDRLRDATRERIRVAPLTSAGMKTVQDVFTYSTRLGSLQGVGATTAQRIRGAARTLWQSTFDEMPVRIEIKNPTDSTSALVQALATWDGSRRTKNAASDLARTRALTPLAERLSSDEVDLLVMGASNESIARFLDAVDAVVRRADLVSGTSTDQRQGNSWEDFLARPADYFAMLAELGFLVEDDDITTGGLPDEIVEAVRKFELHTDRLRASLRGYQSFAARFALVQRKVIIGDEMGLGKTVEALAVLAHLASRGELRSVVICPAAVVTNWVREIEAKSVLRAHRLHGPSRESALRSWRRQGGVAVTTYESLGWLEPALAVMDDLPCVVLDEAHYIKNPDSLRARRSAALIARADRAVLLTGTPLENRVEEFRHLVSYLRPDLLLDATDLRPRLFRQQVAPAYLRRNQEDVLLELPERVEVYEWLPMSSADSTAYRQAVYSGNFHEMRQACMLQQSDSAKIDRLIEIVQEAEDNGRRVLVFSNYIAVLEAAVRALPGRVFGPLTGSVPAAARQKMVDDFSAADSGAVLVAQIAAGGVGLNIQAASVVVICEPQLKPTAEWQAIARAHRMGQLQSVQVHRLLSEVGVDVRITELLARKKATFDDFAAISETAGSAPEAVDISEADLVRDVIQEERQRLFAGVPQAGS